MIPTPVLTPDTVEPPLQAAAMAGEAVLGLRQSMGDDLVAVALFGSRARGDAKEWSDWDLLVGSDFAWRWQTFPGFDWSLEWEEVP